MVHGPLATLRRKGYQGRSPWLVGVEPDALRRILAVRVKGFQKVGPRFDGVGQPDPQRAVGGRRRNRGDRIGQLFSAGLVDEHYLRPDPEVPICRRDYAVL